MNISRGKLSVVFSLAILSMLAACGRPGSPSGYEGQTDRCSSQFMADWNKVMKEPNGPKKLTKARGFNQKYNGVQCVAQATYQDTGMKTTMTVDSAKEMAKVIESLASPTLDGTRVGLSGDPENEIDADLLGVPRASRTTQPADDEDVDDELATPSPRTTKPSTAAPRAKSTAPRTTAKGAGPYTLSDE